MSRCSPLVHRMLKHLVSPPLSRWCWSTRCLLLYRLPRFPHPPSIHPAASSAGSRVHALTRGWRAGWGQMNHPISQLVDSLTGVRYKSCLPLKHASRQRSPPRALTHPSWGRASHPLPSGARAAAASSHDQRPHIALSNRCDGPWSGVAGR